MRCTLRRFDVSRCVVLGAALSVSAVAVACSSSDSDVTKEGSGGAGVGGAAAATSGATSAAGGATTGSSGTGGAMMGCGNGAWATYAHDAQRTSASDGCVQGALTTSWRYEPAPPSGKKVNMLFHAIADSGAAYLAWAAQNDPYLGTTALDRVGPDGMRVWTWDSGTDTNVGNWPTLAGDIVVVNDDGLYYLASASGQMTKSTGVDYWGQTAFVGGVVYAVNSSHVDGPGIFVGAFDTNAMQLWQQNTYGMCRIDVGDVNNAIAVDSGAVFFAPTYRPGSGVNLPFGSGVYAFDAQSGAPKWAKQTTPTSAVSAASGKVYLVESGSQLVARNESDGGVAWSASVTGPGVQAPVLASGRVIVATAAGISAFDAASGAAAWSAPVMGAASASGDLTFSGGCVSGSAMWAAMPGFGGAPSATTTLAAALGSATLVATAADGIHVLSLADGHELWKGAVAQANGPVRSPVIVGHTVYIADSSGLLALSGG